MRHPGTAPLGWPHGTHRDHGLIFSECHPCSRLTLLPISPVAQLRSQAEPLVCLSLPLQLLLELVEEAPVSSLGDDLLRAQLDHPGLVEAESIEAHCVLGGVLTPTAVWDVLHGLQRVVVAGGELVVDERPRHPFRFERA